MIKFCKSGQRAALKTVLTCTVGLTFIVKPWTKEYVCQELFSWKLYNLVSKLFWCIYQCVWWVCINGFVLILLRKPLAVIHQIVRLSDSKAIGALCLICIVFILLSSIGILKRSQFAFTTFTEALDFSKALWEDRNIVAWYFQGKLSNCTYSSQITKVTEKSEI